MAVLGCVVDSVCLALCVAVWVSCGLVIRFIVCCVSCWFVGILVLI